MSEGFENAENTTYPDDAYDRETAWNSGQTEKRRRPERGGATFCYKAGIFII